MFRSAILALCALSLTACNSQKPPAPTVEPAGDALPSVTQMLTCLRSTGPIIAAHRGRDKARRDPENALSSLRSLKDAGFIIAEVDVARLKDGTHILQKQADYLRGLSSRITGETLLISGPKGKTRLQWLGTKQYNQAGAQSLKRAGKFSAYGMMSPKYAKSADYAALSILVSDYPKEAKAKAGIKRTDRARANECKS